LIEVAAEVREASAVVALETTLIAHGFPPGEGIAVGLESEARVREAGAVPATIGVLDGVHRGWNEHLDVSSDLGELARTRCVVVSAGAKSLLDVPATMEALETLAVPVIGFRTDELPLFYSARGGPPVPARVESVAEAAAIARAHWELGGGGLLVAHPPDESLDDVEPLIEDALRDARERGVTGKDVTPFVLSWLHERSGGRTLAANRALVVANAGLAAEIALAL
jgi:pseudouridine-5'-phosphate glycosidase